MTLAVHAAARRPVFYTTLGVPDTFDGRFELLVLHGHLMIRRLRQDGDVGAETAQNLFDALIGHFDEALREIGVGDMSVGKRMKTMASGVYGRLAAYDAGLDSEGPDGLEDVVRRNVYGTAPDADASRVQAVAAYMRAAERHLATRPHDAVLAGVALYPEPLAPADGEAGMAAREADV
ncbi:MAG: ubiquinol-cytochrome C chaperone [Alphaproteobacteria bacterium]|nr:ubiquinol-cytochrome C chaperone [Alphaproteobacteria bacterium]MCB9928839.1 ubiquinol-cytochrome C chaperone [Alphaproteobacteria bacterium]